MLHPHTELRFMNDEVGYGVFATRPIPRGTITWARCELDQTFEPAHVQELTGLYRDLLDKYSFVDGQGLYVLCWDHGRYVNHSCRPTCLAPGLDFELAVRDIAAGEQVTDDYGTLNLEWSFECRCGEPTCRGRVLPDDLLRLADSWDAEVRATFPLITAVAQPLWEILQEKDTVRALLDEGGEVPSCRQNYRGVRKEAARYRFAPRTLAQR